MNRQKRIVFLVRSLDIGGAERQLIALARELGSHDWDVAVVTFYPGELDDELQASGVTRVCLNKRGRWDILRFGYRLLRTMRSLAPGVVHAYLPTENVLIALLKPFIRPTTIVWGIRSSNPDYRDYGLLARATFGLNRLLATRADVIISNSLAGKLAHAKLGFPSARIVVIPNGIDTERFRSNADARGRTRERWRIGADQLAVGLIARIDPMKDHVTFIHAAAQVAHSRDEARFICIGDGPAASRAELEALASDLGLGDRLSWEPSTPDVQELYCGLDLLVLSSSRGEGFPNVLAEAMAAELACVTTDVGDARLVVDGAGWVCEPQSPGLLAERIVDALTDAGGRVERGRLGRRRVIANYSLALLGERTSAAITALRPSRANGRGV